MIDISRSTNSCGILEVNGISGKDARLVLKELYDKMHGNSRKWAVDTAFVTFSDVTSRGYIQKLRDEMLESKFQNVTYLNEAVNPNSGNTIGVLIWQFDKKTLKNWHDANKESFAPPKNPRKFRVLKDTCAHQAPIGSIVTMRYDSVGSEMLTTYGFRFEEVPGNYIRWDEVEEIIDEVANKE